MLKGQNRKGFTLIELMVVVAVIGISLTIAIPSYIAMMPHLRLKTAARDVVSALQLARMRAISNNQDETVYFDLGDDIMTYHKLPDPGWIDVDLFTPSGTMDDDAAPFHGDKAVFKSNGTADLTDDKEGVYLQNKGDPDETYRVTVVKLTGIIKLQAFVGSDWEDR